VYIPSVEGIEEYTKWGIIRYPEGINITYKQVWGSEGIKSKEDRLNLSGSWHSGHSRAYNPCFCI
jgi:hypothetical protein